MQNGIAKTLLLIGFVFIIGGFLLGLLAGTQTGYNKTDFVWMAFLMPTLGGFVSGMIFIGFSEVINKLHSIDRKINLYDRLDLPLKEDKDTLENDNKEIKQVIWNLDEDEKEKIYKLYPEQNIVEIIPTPYKWYCIVILNNEDGIKIVDIGGFSARESDKEIKNDIMNWYNENN